MGMSGPSARGARDPGGNELGDCDQGFAKARNARLG
jgi:hypothetical protein